MTAYAWTPSGLIPRLNARLQPDSHTMYSPVEQPTRSVVTRNSINQPHPTREVFSEITRLKRKLMVKVNHLLSHLITNLEKSTFDYEHTGEITVRGRQIPGSNLVDILVSLITKGTLVLGEMVILHLLAYAPRAIKKYLHKKKKTFIKYEFLNDRRRKKRLKSKRVTKEKNYITTDKSATQKELAPTSSTSLALATSPPLRAKHRGKKGTEMKKGEKNVKEPIGARARREKPKRAFPEKMGQSPTHENAWYKLSELSGKPMEQEL